MINGLQTPIRGFTAKSGECCFTGPLMQGGVAMKRGKSFAIIIGGQFRRAHTHQ